MDSQNGAGLGASPLPGGAPATGLDLPFFTLRGLVNAAGSAIRMGLPREAWVEAQIVQARRTGWGLTLDLIEAGAQDTLKCAKIRCNAFKNVVERIEADLGLELDPAVLTGTCAILKVRPHWDPRYQLELRLVGLNPAMAQGLLAQAVERVRAALRSEGIFDAQRRLPVPEDVTRVAVIHPDGGAGWGDVERELRRWQATGILDFVDIPACFEGARAVSSLADALGEAGRLAAAGEIDLVCLVRGGGDPSGLACVSNESVARRLLAVPVPVVVGLGHARDRTLVDEIAWRAADTPSKAVAVVKDLFTKPALAAIGHWAAIRRDMDRAIRLEAAPALERDYERLQHEIGPRLQAERAALERFRATVEVRRAEVLVELRQLRHELARCADTLCLDAAGRPFAERAALCGLYEGLLGDARTRADGLDDLEPRGDELKSALTALLERQETELLALLDGVGEGIRRSIAAAASELGELRSAVQALDADALLARGYVLAVGPGGTLIGSAEQAASLERFSLHFADGELAVVPAKP